MFFRLPLLLLICTFVCVGDGTVQHCEAGTHGAMAGAPTVALGCPSCPAGSVSGSPSSAACEACVAPLVASPNVQTCTAGCGYGAYLSGRACVACTAGFTTPTDTAHSAAECVPCAAGTYANPHTGGVCVACADGTTSPAGAHNCVVVCPTSGAGMACASTGSVCAPMTRNFAALTQTVLAGGGNAQDTTVQQNGGVYFTDKSNVYYYMDDCTPSDAMYVSCSYFVATL